MSELEQTPPPVEGENRPFQFSLRTMFDLTFLCAVFFSMVATFGLMIAIVLALLAGWVAGVVYAYRRGRPAWVGWPVLALAAISFLIGISDILHPGLSREHVRQVTCARNLGEIGTAIIMYRIARGYLPPAYIADESGKPMHSWRVLILPYLGRKDIYNKYKFDEPWDGPNNSKLHDMIVACYGCPSDELRAKETDTNYVVVVGPGTLFTGTESVDCMDVEDSLGSTLMVVEVANSGIHWMEPRDLHVVQMAPDINPQTGQGISSGHPGGVNMLFADGHTEFMCADNITPEELRATLSRNGGEEVDRGGL